VIILDTHVVLEIMRPRPEPVVMGWLDMQYPDHLFLTAVTLSELVYGAHVLPAGKRRDRFNTAIESLASRDFPGRILPFDQRAAWLFGIQMAVARKAGKAISRNDGFIAAIALANDVTAVATRDTTPFEVMSVGVVNPWLTENRQPYN